MASTAGITNFFGTLSPETKAALIQSGFGAVGNVMAGKAQESATKYQTGATALDRANTNILDVHKNALDLKSQDFADKQREVDAADRLVLGAMGSSPLDFANQRGKMQAKAEIMSKPMVPNYLRAQVPSFMANGLSPQTIQMMMPSAEKEKGYWDAVAMGSKGRFQGANLAGSYGDQGRAVDEALAGTTGKSGESFNTAWTGYESGRDAGINQMVTLANGQKIEAQKLMGFVDEKAKKEGGKWATFGKILKTVGPIVAMAIPAIGVPLSIAIAAASSTAGSKLEGNSWGSALAAGGIGGATAGVLGGASSSLGKVAQKAADKTAAQVAARYAAAAAG